MKNGSKIFDNPHRSNSLRQFGGVTSPRERRIFSAKRIYNSKNKFKEFKNRNQNNRYGKINRNNNCSNNFVNDKDKIFKSLELTREKSNEKSVLINKSILEYNIILSLLDKIMEQNNSFETLIKIKNYIHKFVKDNEKKYLINTKSCNVLFHPTSESTSKKKIKNNQEKEINKEDGDLEGNNNNLTNKNDNKSNNKNYLNRRVKKLYNKINELETKSNIEQLKYLFFIVEQEKKIVELEKNFEIKEIPLDERIIEKMRELKCYPAIIRSVLNTKKKNKLNLNEPKINSLTLRSRNKKEIDKEYSFDRDKKEKEFIIKKYDSFINKNENKIKKTFQFSKINKDFNLAQFKKLNQINNNNDNVNNNKNNKVSNIVINFSKPVNQLFNKKNFFVTHPKLKYVKDTPEKNHFLKLKTKEHLTGESNILSNINLASKSQKNTINDFSNYINNSMANFEKLKL